LKREKVTVNEISQRSMKIKSNWMYYALILLTLEKTIQHIVVTLAFYFNWRGIVSTVVVDPGILMIVGAIVAVLFGISLSGLIRKHPWAVGTILYLALFDIIGEFVVQGTLVIIITVSFLVAVVLFFLASTYRRQSR